MPRKRAKEKIVEFLEEEAAGEIIWNRAMYTFNVLIFMYVHKLFKLMLLPQIQNDENAVEENLNLKKNIFITLCCRREFLFQFPNLPFSEMIYL